MFRFPEEDEVRLILCLYLGTAVITIILLLLFFKVPNENRDLVIALSSGLLGCLATLIAVYAKPTTAAERKKDDTINKQANALKTQSETTAKASETPSEPTE